MQRGHGGHGFTPRKEPTRLGFKTKVRRRTRLRTERARNEQSGAQGHDLSRWMRIRNHWVERGQLSSFIDAVIDEIHAVRDQPPKELERMFHGVVANPKKRIESVGTKTWQRIVEDFTWAAVEAGRPPADSRMLAHRIVYAQILAPEFFAKERSGMLRGQPSKREEREIKRKLPKSAEGVDIEHGYQSLPTRIVRKYAERFPGRDIGTVQRIIDEINAFERVEVKHFFEKIMYQKQTAEDLIATRRIPARKFSRKVPAEIRALRAEGGQRFEMIQFGCNSMSVALASVLRAKRIPAWYVRTTGLYHLGEPTGVSHSVVRFRLNGRDYLADPHATKPADRLLDLNTREMRENVARLKEMGAWVEGKDSWDIGISAWEDFDKHNPSVKDKGRKQPAIEYEDFKVPAERE